MNSENQVLQTDLESNAKLQRRASLAGKVAQAFNYVRIAGYTTILAGLAGCTGAIVDYNNSHKPLNVEALGRVQATADKIGNFRYNHTNSVTKLLITNEYNDVVYIPEAQEAWNSLRIHESNMVHSLNTLKRIYGDKTSKLESLPEVKSHLDYINEGIGNFWITSLAGIGILAIGASGRKFSRIVQKFSQDEIQSNLYKQRGSAQGEIK